MKQAIDKFTADFLPRCAVLFARSDSFYKTIPDLDVFDIDRDARTWSGGVPVVAHPPCRAWGRLRQFSKPAPGEKELALLSIAHVRKFGGVVEHPAHSTLFIDADLPRPGEFLDEFGGWTLEIEQFHFGHKAQKLTWLYIVGIPFGDVGALPKRSGSPLFCIRPSKNSTLKICSKADREHTPPDLAHFLVDIVLRASI